MTEINQNPMPEIRLFPKLERVGRVLSRLWGFLPFDAPDHMSNHKVPFEEPYTWHHPAQPCDYPTFADDFDDSIEYWRVHHQPDDIYDPQMPFVMNHPEADTGWDSEGNYHDDDLATIIPLFPKDVA